MKLSDTCPYEFPCLMIGKKGTPWTDCVFIMAINELKKHTHIDAIVVKVGSKCFHSLGENFLFDQYDIMEDFKPYHGQVIIHSEQLNPNFEIA